jgi:hypothetical protein
MVRFFFGFRFYFRLTLKEKEKYVLEIRCIDVFDLLGMANFSMKYRKIQNYFRFRSAEYQRPSNHSTKPYLLTKKVNNQSYMENRSNENNTQEYHRYRNSTYHPPAQV